MRRLILASSFLLMVACSNQGAPASTSDPQPGTTRPTLATTSTTLQFRLGGHVVKMDPSTLQPVPGLEAIPLHWDWWHAVSADGSRLITFQWDEALQVSHGTAIDVESWTISSSFDLEPHVGDLHVVHDSLYAYLTSGALVGYDLSTGKKSVLDQWPEDLWPRAGFHVLPDGRLAAIMTGQTATPGEPTSVFVLDPNSGATKKHDIAPLDRVTETSGVLYGDEEILEVDEPAVVWDQHRVLVIHADPLHVLEIDLDTGTTRAHDIIITTWLDRLIAFWVTPAQAKGPALGTVSSAALSPDGRFLYISGNHHRPGEGSDGQLIETREPEGITVVDTDSWKAVAVHEAPVGSVGIWHDVVVGAEVITTEPWTEHFYMLAPEDPTTLIDMGPMPGPCEPWQHDNTLLCYQHQGGISRLSLVDMTDMSVVATRQVDSSDYMLRGGVLLDSLPLEDS